MQIYTWHQDQQGATQLFQQSFKASINQYEYLPALLAKDKQILASLQNVKKNHNSLNQHLKFVSQRSGSTHVFVMDMFGHVIAASNFDKTNSFLNENYAFRPYFAKAISQHKRQFYYAIGATTGIPGFFISEPILSDNLTLLGVVVVKLDLRDWEVSWKNSQRNILLSDDNQVVILSSHDQWRYKTIGALSSDALIQIEKQRQFPDQTLNNLVSNQYRPTHFLGFNTLFWRIDDQLYLVNAFRIKESAWTLYSLIENKQFIQSAGLFFILLFIGLLLSYLYLAERRSKLLSRLHAEQKIKEINASLEEKVQKRTKALRDAQEELVQQSKVAALGQMAATIVHELSQPLSAMNSSIAAINLKVEKKNWEGAIQSINRLSPLGKKMNAVIKLLKSFSYQDDNALKNHELAPLINKSLTLYKDCLKEKNIHLKHLELQQNVFVKVNTVKLDLVIVNIIQNAVDAMEKCDHPEISISMESQKDIAIINIEDIGGGIDSRVMGQLFNPYFTTKDIGKGLGLGLSICHEIIREYGGEIEVKNSQHGAHFMIKLPLFKST